MQRTAEYKVELETGLRAERRGGHRRRVFKGARLVFNGGYGTFECVVRDQSDRGAKVMLGDVSGVPACFDLVISGASAAQPVNVRWRLPGMLGVSWG